MPRVKLSKPRWREIQQAGELQERSREKIESVLSYYRYLRQASATQPRAARTRGELRRIAELAEKLLTAIIGTSVKARGALSGEIDGLIVDKILSGTKRSILAALMPPAPSRDANNVMAGALAVSQGLGMPRRDTLTELCQWLSAVEGLCSLFERAASSLPPDPPGAHKAAQIHLWLVSQLDVILVESTGGHVNRSYKNDLQHYVEKCFEAADRKVGAGSIKKAIEDYIASNPKRQRARAKKLRRKGARNYGTESTLSFLLIRLYRSSSLAHGLGISTDDSRLMERGRCPRANL
jgi:hypothetical protein